MSIVLKETIEVIAQSIGVSNLTPDVAVVLAPDVEYRVREIMQEAIKCMRHSKRTTLTADDVDTALKLRKMEPIYGYSSGDSLRFRRADGHRGLYYIDDKDVEFKDVIESPLPKAPPETSINAHWLAIEGVPPVIENSLAEDGKKSELREDDLPNDIKLPIKQVLSKEHQLYFTKITDLTVNKSGSILFQEALLSLSRDSGLHPLLPYLTYFISDEVARNLSNLPLLLALMRVVRCLLQNPHVHIELYLHQLMSSVITCLVGKGIGNRLLDNHWELRNLAASLVASICKRYGHIYHNLQPRIMRTLLHAFLDPSKALPQHYGAIQGLAALGPSVVRLLILPNLEPYLQLLQPEMLLENQKNEMKRHEAWQVYGALQFAASQCLHDRLNMLRAFLAPPIRTNWKSAGKVASLLPNKRRASMDNLTQQPALKKMATDGTMGVVPMNSMQVDMQGAASGLSAPLGSSNVGIPSISRQLPNGNRSGKEGGSQGLKVSSVLAQAWKEDTDSGQLLASLSEIFGESFLLFTPKPELSFFV